MSTQPDSQAWWFQCDADSLTVHNLNGIGRVLIRLDNIGQADELLEDGYVHPLPPAKDIYYAGTGFQELGSA